MIYNKKGSEIRWFNACCKPLHGCANETAQAGGNQNMHLFYHCYSCSLIRRQLPFAKLLLTVSFAIELMVLLSSETPKRPANCPQSTSNSSSERSFSSLRCLKTWLRATMLQERLIGLALLHIHHDTVVKSEEVVDRFSKMGNHRIVL